MSVLIRMEMPTTCGNCPVRKLWAEDDEAQCMINRTLWTKYSKRNPNCPLIPIPPHGRLIDADALIERCKDEKGNYYSYEAAIVAGSVEVSPTVIEAEGDKS